MAGDMSQHQIEEKLQEEFKRELTSEAQGVYVLVEVGKLFEHRKAKKHYKAINFYRNWVVHTKLEQSEFADDLVRTFDEYIANNNQDSSKRMKDLVSPLRLRHELNEFLGEHVKSPYFENDILWKRFVKYLAGVIDQTPLHYIPSNKRMPSPPTKHVKSITVSRTRNQQGRAMLRWEAECHTLPPPGVQTTLDVVLLEGVDVIMLAAHPRTPGSSQKAEKSGSA